MPLSNEPSTSRKSDSPGDDSSLNSTLTRRNQKRPADNEPSEKAKRIRNSTPTDNLQPAGFLRDAAEKETYGASGLKNSLHGTVYQLKHLMLIIHRAREMKYSFRLATEMDIAEKFDDVVLSYKDSKGDKFFRFVQAKHKQDETKLINASDLLNVKDGDFSILKYFISWRKIKKHPDFRGSKLKDFILCTNIGIKVDDLKKKDINVIQKTDTDNFLNTTNTKKQPRHYKLSVKNPSGLWKTLKSASSQVTNPEISCFLDEFILAVNQPNEIELSEIIERDISPEFNRLDAGIVRDSFQIEILDWFKTKRGEFLTGDDADDFFDKMKGKLSSIKTMAVGLDHTEKLEELGIWFDNENTELQNFINSPNVASKQLLEMISSKQTLLTALRVFQTLTKTRKCEKNENFTIVRLETLSRQKIMELVLRAFEWSADHNFLVVDCESNSAKKHLQTLWIPACNIMAKNVNKRMIVITQAGKDLGSECSVDRQTYRVKNSDHSFGNLTNESQKKLLGKQVTQFQGQDNKTSFGELLGIQDCDNLSKHELQDLAEIMDSDTLVELISKDGIPIGCEMKGLDEILHCYICRTICQHVVIKKAILEDDRTTDLLALSGINRVLPGELLQMGGGVPNKSVQIREISPMEHSTQNLTILDSGQEEEQFNALCAENEDRNVHWLQWKQGVSEKEEYVWKKSRGNITHLVRHRDAIESDDNNDKTTNITYLSEDDLTSHNEIVIISDTAGMGKSTMLTHLASKIKKNGPDMLVLKFDLNHHAAALEKVEEDSSYDLSSINGAIQFVIKEFLSDETNLARKVCKRIIKRKQKVALIFDGFDEISPDYEHTVINLLETFANYGIKKLVVATRPHTRELLETKLNTFAYEIHPFSIRDQERFLTHYWKAKVEDSEDDSEEITENRIKQYATAIVNKLADSIHDQKNKFTGIPLQAKLVAEIFETRREGAQERFHSCKEFIDSEVDEPKFPKRIDLIYLYKHFVEKKFDAFFIKTGGNFAAVATKKAKRQCFERFVDKHKRLALDALFDKNEIKDLLQFQRNSTHGSLETTDADIVERDGIITRFINGQPQFGHRTYAEYFAAKFFSDILKMRVQNESLEKIFVGDILLERNYETMRVFMDGLLSEVHVDVLQGEFWPRCLKTRRSQRKETIFHVAAAEGCGRIIELFLNCLSANTGDQKFLINVKDSDDRTAVHRAVEYGHLDTIRLLIEGTNFDINSPDVRGVTSLSIAAHKCKLDVVKYLVEKKADINSKVKNGFTPLHYATMKGKSDVVEYLVSKGANINSQDKNGLMPLHIAAEEGKLDIVDYLVGKGANINSQTQSGPTPLYYAAMKGKLNVVQYLVGKGADINSQNDHGWTPQHIAALGGKLDVVEYLVGKGADINSQDKRGRTPQHIAVLKGKLDVVEYLVGKGAHINSQNEDGSTPLHLAAREGQLNVVQYLVGKGADINSRDKDGRTPLHDTAYDRTSNVVQYLVGKGADINSQDKNGWTPLHNTAYHRTLNVVQYLVSKGADINSQNNNGSTPLHVAASEGKLDMVEYLVNKGADINPQNKYDWKPLHAAAQGGQLNIVEYLIRKGADINSRNKNGWTPLHIATQQGNFNVVQYLVGEGANINSRNINGWTSLYIAAQVELNVVQYLVGKGADINSQNENGWQPLHAAALKGKLDIVDYLVGKGADINSQDKKGWTPLHIATQRGNFNVVQYLVGEGADINSQDKNGWTPLHIATQGGNFNVVQYLVGEGADINSQNEDGWQPLHAAALKGKLDIVDYLVGKGADINSQDKKGSTPLYVAAHEGELNVVEYLVGKGADINSQDKKGSTPLYAAAQQGKLNVVQCLVSKGADINSRDKDGTTPLHSAAIKEELNIVEYLVGKGADINSQHKDGWTPLHFAAHEGKLNVVQYLAGKGADINFQNKNGLQPLHTAALQGKLDVVEYLVDKGADINSQDKTGWTPLYAAARTAKLNVVEYLIDKGADINSQDENGWTPLYAAAQEGKFNIVQYLIGKGADQTGSHIIPQDINGSTAL